MSREGVRVVAWRWRRKIHRLRGAFKRLMGRNAPLSADTVALADYVLGFCRTSIEAESYARIHLGRFVRTLQIAPRGTSADRVLEMGAYLQVTPALKTKLGYGEVRGCYLGPLGKTDEKSVTSSSGETFACSIDLFDAEADQFPYPDGHFATVLCCELLEHLPRDPMHMMAELNRVVRVGGHLVLSTPNICALRAVAAVIDGYHPGLFSLFTKPQDGGVREPPHAREYTPREIALLLEASGFEVKQLETGPYGMERPDAYDWVARFLRERGHPAHLREDAIHAVGRKVGPVKERYPAWLYA